MKIKILIGAAAFAMTISSCADFIDLKPENQVTYTNGMETPTAMESILSNAQGRLQSILTKLYMQDYSGAYTNGCNDRGFFQSGGLDAISHNWLNPVAENGRWNDHYATIGMSNIIISNIKDEWSLEHKNYFNGQAMFIKGMCYFDLSRRWGRAPIVPDNDYEAPAVPSASSLDLINKAILEAEGAFAILPRYANLRFSDGNSVDNKQYASKEIAAALLAHAYAWKAAVEPTLNDSQRKESWGQADKYASMLIDGELAGYATLESTIESLKTNTLNSRYGKEAIFELDYNPKYTKVMHNVEFYIAHKFFGYPYKEGSVKGSSTPFSVSCKRIIDLYGLNSGDQRLANYFDVSHYDKDVVIEWPDTPARVERVEFFPGNFMDQIVGGLPESAANRAYVKKFDKQFIATEDPNMPVRFYNFDCNKIIWRLADIILLRAEVRNFMGNINGATTDLNEIRKRANVAQYPTATDTEGLQKAIFREREKELIYENHRFYDILRNKDYYKVELTANFRSLSDMEYRNGALYLPESASAGQNNSKFLPNIYWFGRRN